MRTMDGVGEGRDQDKKMLKNALQKLIYFKTKKKQTIDKPKTKFCVAYL